MSDLKARLDALQAEATPAPWTTGKGTKTIREDYGYQRAIATTAPRYHPQGPSEAANAAFIVALVNAYAAGDLIIREERDTE